jgi:excisionase family DNA binding protein
MVHSLLLEQAAELLGVSRRTIYDRIREGRLRTIRAQCGSQRVLIASIEALLREQAARQKPRVRRCRCELPRERRGVAARVRVGPQRHRSRATWSISSCR